MDLSATLAIAYRDLLKFLRDPLRLVSTLIFPAVSRPTWEPILGTTI